MSWTDSRSGLSGNITERPLFLPRICQKYEEIIETISSIPENTQQLVTLDQFILKTTEDTIFKLIDEINVAICRLRFLMAYAVLPRMSNILPYIQLQTEHLNAK